MSLTFWETVRGVELADTLIRNLPAIAESSKNNEELLSELKVLKNEVESIKEIIRKED